MHRTFLWKIVIPVLLIIEATCLSGVSAEPFAAVLQTTLTNPTPAVLERFGAAIALMGDDRVLIGAPGANDFLNQYGSPAGAAYLFDVNGALLTTFNPHGAWNFGWSIATLADSVYLGAEYGVYSTANSGVLYLCDANGYCSQRFWNTNRSDNAQDSFSASVASLGNDRLIVGAPDAGWYLPQGAVFLFSGSEYRNTPLTTVTNPFPSINAGPGFGSSVAAVGHDFLLAGDPGDDFSPGNAYLFDTNGVLLTSFTNRTSATAFGYSLAALGRDRVIIGAPGCGFGSSGLAFLFRTNGALLATFSNPVPTNSTALFFGGSVAAVGSDRVLIGASQGRTNTGAAFLFSTNGTLLATLVNPTGATNDTFGDSVLSVGSDRVLIGDTSGGAGGAVYLFKLVPTLAVAQTSSNTLAISWSALAQGYSLQQVTHGMTHPDWSTVTEPVENDGTNNSITTSSLAAERYYRLVKP